MEVGKAHKVLGQRCWVLESQTNPSSQIFFFFA
uniref:Uncharacterized protein n=1 Tax=Rhizophora mucronata TaxID=61149 RepID=A0A2P2J4Q8_RHIMU